MANTTLNITIDTSEALRSISELTAAIYKLATVGLSPTVNEPTVSAAEASKLIQQERETQNRHLRDAARDLAIRDAIRQYEAAKARQNRT